MDLIKYWIKYINYPLVMKITGNSESVKTYNRCIFKQYQPLEENIIDRNEALYRIVQYAMDNVPYYTEIAREQKIQLSKETIIEDIKKFPVLTKDIIRREGERLYSTQNVEHHIATSGGSTGEPVKLLHDNYLEKVHPGNYLLSYAGYEPGDKVVHLWGSERDILQGTIGFKAAILNRFVTRRKLLNTFMMAETDMANYVHIINKWKPKVILAYVQSAYELARYIKREKISVFSPSGIVVSAGTLFPDWKKEIEEVFRCPVINQYGSRETSGIAISCSESDKLHINTFMNYVEIVDDNGNNLPNDVDGNIIVTNLLNQSMPLIRYKIGDVGSLSSDTGCKCGRNLPCLNYVKGRTVNIFKRRDGARIDGEYFTHLFYGIEQIRKFQVIQHDYEKIEIVIEINNEKLKESTIQNITKNIRVVMGDTCEIEFRYVDKLLPSKSGKYLYTISLI